LPGIGGRGEGGADGEGRTVLGVGQRGVRWPMGRAALWKERGMSDARIRDMIARNPGGGKLQCAVAHYIAASLGVAPLEVGREATDMGVKLDQCQLGLFGYGRKGRSSYKILGRKVEVEKEVLDAIRSAARGGRVACAELWRIADAMGLARAEVGNAADSLGIKIAPCQLGAF